MRPTNVARLHLPSRVEGRRRLVLALVAAGAGLFPEAIRAQDHTAAKGLLAEPAGLRKIVESVSDRIDDDGEEPEDGFSVTTGDMIPGAGFLSAGPAFRKHLFGQRAVLKASAAVSIKYYSTAQLGIELPHLAHEALRLGAHTFFQDALQVNYFGLGNESSPLDRSGYRLTTNDLIGYAVLGRGDLRLTARLGLLTPVDVSPMAGRRPDYPDTVQKFTEITAPAVGDRLSFVHGDITVSADTRDTPGHPTSGGLYQATWAAFDDRSGRTYAFQRVQLDAAHFTTLGFDNWTLAVRGWVAATRAASPSDVPFYLMPSVGGSSARAFRDYRFQDRNAQAYSAESRLALFRHLDAAVFADFASVAPTISRLSLSQLKSSYGAGVRLHTGSSTAARLDVAHGAEGWRVVFKLSDPFRPSSQVIGRPPVVPHLQ